VNGPYETGQEFLMTSGRIDLRCGELAVTATVLAGDVEITLTEEVDEQIYAFGSDQPVRFTPPRRRVRLVVEASLDQMRIEYDLPPGS
jgi:hypothetical protein